MALFVKHETTMLDTVWLGVPGVTRGCHATAELLAKRTEDDGWFRRALLTREGFSDFEIDDTIAAGLIEADGDMLRPVGWLDRNPSQAAIGAKRASKSEAGRKGNHTKWKHPGDYESCPLCQVIAGSDRTGSQSDRTGSQSDRTSSPESESDLETASDRSSDPVARIRSQRKGSPDAAKRALAAVRSPKTTAAGEARA